MTSRRNNPAQQYKPFQIQVVYIGKSNSYFTNGQIYETRILHKDSYLVEGHCLHWEAVSNFITPDEYRHQKLIKLLQNG